MDAHEAWIASQLAAITPFARIIIPARVMEDYEADPTDYMVRLLIAGDVQLATRLEALSDDELAAEYARNREYHRAAIELDDPSEYDVDDRESYYRAQWEIEELQAYRAAQARYTSLPSLTHKPFASLAMSA
jgi:hypothetical protein